MLLQEGQKTVSMLHNIDKEHKGYSYASQWFDFCCNALENLGEMLTLDDVMIEDEATQAGTGVGCSHAVDEPRSSSRQCKHR